MTRRGKRNDYIVVAASYLVAVHFEFPDNLYRDLAKLTGAVSGAVDITEGTISHFFQQDPALQAGVRRHLRFALPFLGNDPLYLRLTGL